MYDSIYLPPTFWIYQEIWEHKLYYYVVFKSFSESPQICIDFLISLPVLDWNL